jgi:hypothetical protein
MGKAHVNVEQDRGHFRIVNSKVIVKKKPEKEDLD